MNSRIRNSEKLFEFWCEVIPSSDSSSPSAGKIVEKFPERYSDHQVLACIPEFAFPCPNLNNENIISYSFVLTNIDAKWRLGFCRHEPSSARAMILITYLPWHDIFLKFINVLASIKKSNVREFRKFITDVYSRNVPESSQSISFDYLDGTQVQSFVFKRPPQLPSIPENHNLNLYYNFVEPKMMIAVFAAMLNERRIIFTSKNLDTLSSCVQAANSFLYPMVWQHIFIPLLPLKMKDNLMAPMPFLCGVHESVLEHHVRRDEIGEVVILNCDKNIFESQFDDVKDLPSEIVSHLKKQLSNSHSLLGDRLPKIFLNALVRLIGGYRDAFKFNNPIVFDDDTFIDSQPVQYRKFLEKMLHLQIFRQFIEERLEMLNKGEGVTDEFEMEIFNYGNRKNNAMWGGVRNLQDKMNPTFKNAFKTVKTGVKGIKSKIKETSSHIKLEGKSSLGHTSMNSTNRHSAPNSPVFSHKPFFSNDPAHIRLQGNHTSLQNNYSTSVLNSFGSISSPATSPSNSSSSSDMNILAELQTQGFFKFDKQKENSVVSSKINISNINKHKIVSDTKSFKTYQSKPMLPSPTSSNSPSLPTDHSLRKHTTLYDNKTDRNSPPPPPLPPRRPHTNDVLTRHPSHPSKKDGFLDLPGSSSKQEPPKASPDDSKDISDLINLDDSLSLSISDFDPLNDKPSNNLATTIQSFENPVYPYFQNASSNNSQLPPKPADDFELLKSYELHKFVQNAMPATSSTSNCNNNNSSNVVKKATFDNIFDDNFGDKLTDNSNSNKTWTKFD